MSICSVIILVRIQNTSQNYFLSLFKTNENQLTRTGRNNLEKRLKRNRQILYMLLLTNSYFLLSLLPYCVLFILFNGLNIALSFFNLLIHTFMYTNNAFNFIFYGIFSQKYRETLNLVCLKPKVNREFITI